MARPRTTCGAQTKHERIPMFRTHKVEESPLCVGYSCCPVQGVRQAL